VPRAAHEYAGAPGAVQVVSRYDGLASLRASSSRGYADTYGETVLAEGPAAAIDDSASTRWVSSPSTRPQDQWLRMTFSAPRAVHEVQIQPVVGDPFLSPVRRLAVTAGAQRRVVDVDPDGGTVTVGFDGSRVASVTVRILRSGTVGRAPVALAGVHVDGLDPRPTLVVPEPLADGASFAFTTGADVRPCLASAFGPDCGARRRRTPEEPEGLDRTVSVPDGASVDVSGLVVARPTPRARRLLEPVGREQRVKASSVFGSDPRVASRFAWDGSASTAWVPADTDPGPTLTFRWQRARTVSGLRVEAPDAQTAPVRALLTTAEGEHRAVSVSGSAMVSFPSLTTRRLSVTFERPAEGARLVVGDVSLRGADVTQPFDADAVTGAICGLGPHVVVDGVTYQSEVRGTLGDVVEGRPLRLRVCGRTVDGRTDSSVRLAPGTHRISAPPTSEFETVVLAGQGQVAPVSAARSVQLESWRGTQRSARIGPGVESVLSMPSNASPGWRATLDGRALRPVRVDGWQQAWIVPAGSGGRLVIDYPPQRWYGALVGASMVPAALLLLGALLLLVGRRRAGRRQVPALGPPRPRAAAALTAVLLVGLGGAAAVGTVLALVGRRRAWPALLGGLGLLAAGLLDVRDPALPTDGVADVLAAVGFGLILGTAVRGGEEGP
jgi:arabinofuranan 3-O-arabinosyltransferase